MGKTEEFNKARKFYCDFNSLDLEDLGYADNNNIHCMRQYVDEQSREEAIKLLPWYEGTRHKHKGKTWIDIYDDGIKWIKEQEEQP